MELEEALSDVRRLEGELQSSLVARTLLEERCRHMTVEVERITAANMGLVQSLAESDRRALGPSERSGRAGERAGPGEWGTGIAKSAGMLPVVRGSPGQATPRADPLSVAAGEPRKIDVAARDVPIPDEAGTPGGGHPVVMKRRGRRSIASQRYSLSFWLP